MRIEHTMDNVYVLRWGHRPRDFRVTTHVALTARAFGAKGFILSDVTDNQVKKSIEKVVSKWGGSFSFEMGVPWKEKIKEWRNSGGSIVHLTMYGMECNEKLLSKIRQKRGDVLVLVGSQKVPRSFFSSNISDLNIAIGHQPHSEVAAIAVFLDRLLRRKEIIHMFKNAEFKATSSKRGKHILISSKIQTTDKQKKTLFVDQLKLK